MAPESRCRRCCGKCAGIRVPRRHHVRHRQRHPPVLGNAPPARSRIGRKIPIGCVDAGILVDDPLASTSDAPCGPLRHHAPRIVASKAAWLRDPQRFQRRKSRRACWMKSQATASSSSPAAEMADHVGARHHRYAAAIGHAGVMVTLHRRHQRKPYNCGGSVSSCSCDRWVPGGVRAGRDHQREIGIALRQWKPGVTFSNQEPAARQTVRVIKIGQRSHLDFSSWPGPVPPDGKTTKSQHLHVQIRPLHTCSRRIVKARARPAPRLPCPHVRAHSPKTSAPARWPQPARYSERRDKISPARMVADGGDIARRSGTTQHRQQ